jgi:hypothetical protein
MDNGAKPASSGMAFYDSGKVIAKGDPEYIDRLENFVRKLVKDASALETQNAHYKDVIDRLLKDLKIVQTVLLALSTTIKKGGLLTKEQRAMLVRAQKIVQRFSGKKVSKKMQAIYDEIEKVVKELRSQGAQGAFSEAARIVAKRHNKNAVKLYKSFIKHKNLLYVKYPKRRKA